MEGSEKTHWAVQQTAHDWRRIYRPRWTCFSPGGRIAESRASWLRSSHTNRSLKSVYVSHRPVRRHTTPPVANAVSAWAKSSTSRGEVPDTRGRTPARCVACRRVSRAWPAPPGSSRRHPRSLTWVRPPARIEAGSHQADSAEPVNPSDLTEGSERVAMSRRIIQLATLAAVVTGCTLGNSVACCRRSGGERQ